MGILAPLFLAGLAGLSIPLILHLVRRTPKGRQQFSSLMFLASTPPRLTRRSRLDQVLLLLMRLAALARGDTARPNVEPGGAEARLEPPRREAGMDVAVLRGQLGVVVRPQRRHDGAPAGLRW